MRVMCCFQETSVRSCSNVKLSVGGAPLDPNDPLDNVGTLGLLVIMLVIYGANVDKIFSLYVVLSSICIAIAMSVAK